MWLTIRNSRHRLRKSSITWLGSHGHRTRLMVFVGGYSTPVFETGCPRSRELSQNWSNEGSSKKIDPRTAKHFTVSLQIICPLSLNSRHGIVILMTTNDEMRSFA